VGAFSSATGGLHRHGEYIDPPAQADEGSASRARSIAARAGNRWGEKEQWRENSLMWVGFLAIVPMAFALQRQNHRPKGVWDGSGMTLLFILQNVRARRWPRFANAPYLIASLSTANSLSFLCAIYLPVAQPLLQRNSIERGG
jgi:hypothetical protein